MTLQLKDTGWRQQSGHTRWLRYWPLFGHLQHCSNNQWTGRHPLRRLRNLPATGTPGKNAALKEDKKKVSSEHSFVLYLLNKTIKQILFEAGTMKKCKYCKYLGGQLWVKSQAWAVFILIQCHSGVDKRVFVLPRASMALTGAFSKWRSMSLGTVRGLTSPFCLLQIKQRADGLVKKQLKTKAQHLQPNVKFL